MRSKTEHPLSSQIPSIITVWIFALVCGLAVFFIAICLQWVIYDDWLHRSGPLRLVGSVLAFLLTIGFAYRWQLAARRRKIELLQQLEKIRWMNDQIRNSLQAIECLVYAANPHVTDPVKDAVDAIENVLQEVLSDAHPESPGKISAIRATSTSSRV
jgi:hypothetical protein